MRISDWSSDVCSSDLDPVAIVADHIGPEHSTDPAIMDGCRNKGLAPPERGPVEPLEQPFFAAEDQILGLDLNTIPARVAAHDLGTDDPDPAATAIPAQRHTNSACKGCPISLAQTERATGRERECQE